MHQNWLAPVTPRDSNPGLRLSYPQAVPTRHFDLERVACYHYTMGTSPSLPRGVASLISSWRVLTALLAWWPYPCLRHFSAGHPIRLSFSGYHSSYVPRPVLNESHPGFEPRPPPWQGGRLPLTPIGLGERGGLANLRRPPRFSVTSLLQPPGFAAQSSPGLVSATSPILCVQ